METLILVLKALHIVESWIPVNYPSARYKMFELLTHYGQK